MRGVRLQVHADERLAGDAVALSPQALSTLALTPGEPVRLEAELAASGRLGPLVWEVARNLGPDGCLVHPDRLTELGLRPGAVFFVSSARLPQPWFWTFFWTYAGNDDEDEAEDLLLVLDTSGSMAGRPLHKARQALSMFLDRKAEREYAREQRGVPGAEDRIGLLLFGGEGRDGVRLACPPAYRNRTALHAAIRRARADGRTPMAEAVEVALETFAALGGPPDGAPTRRRRMLLVSDGHPWPSDAAAVLALLPRLAGGGIEAATIGVGDAFDRDLLGRLAAGTRSPFLEVQRARELYLALADLV